MDELFTEAEIDELVLNNDAEIFDGDELDWVV